MMTTAWYDLTSRLQSNHVVLQRRHDVPKSWLNKQRQMVNGELSPSRPVLVDMSRLCPPLRLLTMPNNFPQPRLADRSSRACSFAATPIYTSLLSTFYMAEIGLSLPAVGYLATGCYVSLRPVPDSLPLYTP